MRTLPLYRARQSRGHLPATTAVVAALAGPRHRYCPHPAFPDHPLRAAVTRQTSLLPCTDLAGTSREPCTQASH